METKLDPRVPPSLRTWFVVHFWADILVAVPLFLAPVAMLEALGWQAADPYCARIVAAALFGIGIESLLGRNADLSAFVAMLNLKVIWSGVTLYGILWTIVQDGPGRPVGAWAILATFALFHGLWVYWHLQTRKILAQPEAVGAG